MSSNLVGIIPPLITPFVDDEVSTDKLIENLLKYEGYMLAGYVLFGSNGENVFVSREEKLKTIKSVREHTTRTLIVGTGLESIKETISLCNEAADLGADYALVITPSFFKSEMKHRTFLNYYTRVAESVMIPIIIYNVPKFTNVNIETETVIELSSHPNIAGLKDSSENSSRISELADNVHSGFKLIVGTASVLYSGLIVGANAGILALANIAPDQCYQIYRLLKEKEFEKALELQNKMIPVNKAVTSKFGVAGLKAAMDLLGYYGGNPRMPLEPLSEAQIIELKLILKTASLLG